MGEIDIDKNTPLLNGKHEEYLSTSRADRSALNLNGNSEEEELQDKYFTKFHCQAIALICTMLLTFGSHYVALALGSLKNTIKKELDISNTEYNLIQSSNVLVNTILPLLGGFFIDYFGTNYGSIVATTFILIGNFIVALSTNLKSFPLMVFGRALYGVGSGTIVIVQETIISQWFSGRGLGLALGLSLTVSRFATFLGVSTIVPIAKWAGFYGAAFWAAAFVCLLSWLANLFYIYMTIRMKKGLSQEQLRKLKAKKEFKLSHLLAFPGQFWILMLLAYTMIGGWNTFLHLNTELIKLRYGDSEELAAWKASVSQILPIFAPPFLGHYIDKYGNRPKLLFLSAVTFFASLYMIGLSSMSALSGMITFSISLALGVLPLLSSIPLILPSSYIGTGFGLYRTTWSLGSVLQDIIAGRLQDNVKEDKHAYDNTIIFMLCICGLAIAITIIYHLVDKYLWSSYVSLGVKERLEKFETVTVQIQGDEAQTETEIHPILGRIQDIKLTWINYFPVIIHTILLIVGWVLFCIFFFRTK